MPPVYVLFILFRDMLHGSVAHGDEDANISNTENNKLVVKFIGDSDGLNAGNKARLRKGGKKLLLRTTTAHKQVKNSPVIRLSDLNNNNSLTTSSVNKPASQQQQQHQSSTEPPAVTHMVLNLHHVKNGSRKEVSCSRRRGSAVMGLMLCSPTDSFNKTDEVK